MKKILPILLVLFILAGCKKNDITYRVKVSVPSGKAYSFIVIDKGPRIDLNDPIYEKEYSFTKGAAIDIQVSSGTEKVLKTLTLLKDDKMIESVSGDGLLRIQRIAD